MNTIFLQTLYLIGGAIVLPFLPFLFWQGKRVRKKVGRLPDATGETVGRFGNFEETLNLLAIGESTVAGVGAKTHTEALAGQLAKFLSLETEKSVCWHALGESGITARETLERLVPHLPQTEMNLVVVGLGGNDTFKVNSPERWRRDITKIIETLKGKYPKAVILLANSPRVIDFPVLPQPLKFILWRVSQFQHQVGKSLTNASQNVFYFDEAETVDEGFFSDGVHPSEYGYTLWSEAMIKFILKKTASL
jgi:lysophospholipase L1-like esterase